MRSEIHHPRAPHINHHQLLWLRSDDHKWLILCALPLSFHFLVCREHRRIRLIHVGIFNILCAQHLSGRWKALFLVKKKKTEKPQSNRSPSTVCTVHASMVSRTLCSRSEFYLLSHCVRGYNLVILEMGYLCSTSRTSSVDVSICAVNRPQATQSLNRDSAGKPCERAWCTRVGCGLRLCEKAATK